jgi:ATPase subunit of ABC transporter with duplicated ATPase domains
VERLAEAQARTEERVTRLEEAVQRLEEAQARTEERVTRLEEAVARLAEAQARTEERVTRLEEAVTRLAEAQARTEERVAKVEVSLRELAQQVGKLSDTIGFGLEDIARVVLPGWLSRHEGIEVDELTRTFLEVDGEVVEINLYGVGVRDEEKVVVLGEARSRIYEHDVKEFDGMAEKARKVIPHRVYKLLFGYWIHPAAQREAAGRGLTLIASYMR